MLKKLSDFNDNLAGKVTMIVGTMWCAYAFAGIALLSLKDNLHDMKSFIAWFSSQFLQLVLLSIIMVGTQYLNKASEIRAQQDHEMIMSEFKAMKEIHRDLHKELKLQIEELKVLAAANGQAIAEKSGGKA